MSETRHGILRVQAHHPDDEMAYSFIYKEGTNPEEAIDAALAEIRADKELVAAVNENYGIATVRNLMCEMPDEPFNRRGITFETVFCEYLVDGDEVIETEDAA